MNNLNDPPHWNIRPHEREGGADGSKWNYALLVPLLGLAAFRWIWSRESQKEIEKAKADYSKSMKSIQRDLELKYRGIVTENQRALAQLELELEKQQKRVQSYRQALVSQSQQVVQQRRELEQERQQIEEEKRLLQSSGAAAVLYNSYLQKERERQKEANALLKQFEEGLVERQHLRCSHFLPKDKRLELEKNLLITAMTDPVATEVGMEAGLRDIFKHDRHCSNMLNTDKRQNGKLMWLYLRYWEQQVELQKFKRAGKSLFGK
ncbi:coiled-coil domain-containing protein 127 [Latimeria chalumnae]|uniref:Coiled-coil domain containing 127 n=1 Tax=Latimeria chalumnae TaxID=7897 RepID=H3AG97_LATCH|nr:PREDICTED: coiled-coil domain-containing protein 127 [Latimeria chalumnae]XP_014346251.1 PREDICTED: coiled-coil domain-containing protein 127 [Latimeria chalumnae]|eukprot:XP_006000046.1 PREDICTED: coiled-coil domain-containing protein 127 [Latimeria chalumnae]